MRYNNFKQNMEKRVGIVGAGICGLLACKYMLSKGFTPLVFESQPTLGGVWRSTIETTRLQTARPLFRFSDFPWPSSLANEGEVYPSGDQVLAYLKAYADHFGLLDYIRFNTKVTGIEYVEASPSSYDNDEDEEEGMWGGHGEPFGDGGKWAITIHDLLTLSTEVVEVEFVTVCVGRFSDVANMPEFPRDKGPEVFEGQVLHSKDFAELDAISARTLVKGKRVTVVGYQKSALDIAMLVSSINGEEYPCTMICRKPHWNMPDFMPWGVPLGFLFFNRFSELLLHKPGQGRLLSLLTTFLSPLRWAISKFVESYIKHKHKLHKYNMVPYHSFLQEIHSCLIAMAPPGFYDSIDAGRIVLIQSPNPFSFFKRSILVQNEKSLDDNASQVVESDVVIFATGFKGDQKVKDIFGCSKFRDYIMGPSGMVVPLYRHCIHPRIPQVAIMGFSESYANLYTFEIRCRWLSELLAGTFHLPRVNRMEQDIADWDAYLKRYDVQRSGRSCIGTLRIWHNDQLCKDMGWNPRRKKGFLADLFLPYGPMDYAP